MAYAILAHMPGYGWLSTAVTLAILAGFSSVILVMLMGQSRVFYSMANDGLIPKVFTELRPKFRTPFKSDWIIFVFVGLFAGFVPGSLAGDLTSFGTLLAFALVSLGIIIMRKSDPDQARPFRTPLVPLVPILGAVICLGMIVALDKATLYTAFGWMLSASWSILGTAGTIQRCSTAAIRIFFFLKKRDGGNCIFGAVSAVFFVKFTKNYGIGNRPMPKIRPSDFERP